VVDGARAAGAGSGAGVDAAAGFAGTATVTGGAGEFFAGVKSIFGFDGSAAGGA